MFKSIQAFNLKLTPGAIELLRETLSMQQFNNCGSGDMSSEGFAAPREQGQFIHSVTDFHLMCYRAEKKNLPSSVVNQTTKARAKELEEQQGFAPGRKAMKDLKERVIDELLPRAFSVQSQTWFWIDTKNNLLCIDSPTPSKADQIIKLLLRCEKLPLESLRTKTSPVTAMTDWIAGGDAPKGFTIDQDAKLVAPTEDKATVKYTRHTLGEDLQAHIAHGKQCVELAMTWDNKVSFVLTENFAIKRIKPLDTLKENQEKLTANEQERFDADFLISAENLGQLIDDLIYAHGGLLADPLAA